VFELEDKETEMMLGGIDGDDPPVRLIGQAAFESRAGWTERVDFRGLMAHYFALGANVVLHFAGLD
jgi:hypothetical protein